MNKTIFLLIIIFIAIIIALPDSLEKRKRLSKYWSRSDWFSAKKWKNRFPNSAKNEIRRFLENFMAGFAFSSKKRLKFEPDDQIHDIYESLYPENLLGLNADSMEYETFFSILEQEYGVYPDAFWNEKITLGEVFENIINTQQNVPADPQRARFR
jgi:hypothetical protein